MLLPLLLIILTQILPSENDPLVLTKLGKIRGHYKTSFERKKYSAFEGIPYAKPPLGERRFEVPSPVDPWNETWNANSLVSCPQIRYGIFSGVEDCLYINVYVPRENIDSLEKLSVIVHIHGGGFYFNSAHFYASPGYLMDHDVIFVTFNYRLGILGFLSAEDDVLPGNNGLKDQVLALQWTQENIASFGGDPTSVTLTGMSAGGSCVHLHYFSPMSRGLFKRGFSQSGVALNPWVIQRRSLNKTKTIARILACPSTSTRNLVNCLKKRNFKQIVQQTSVFDANLGTPAISFGPVIEKGAKPFLSEEPEQLLKAKNVYDVPWFASFVHDEGVYMVRDFRDNKNLDAAWTTWGPYLLEYNSTSSKQSWGTISQKILKFYLSQNKLDFDTLAKITTDVYITGIIDSVQQHASATNSSVYLFELSYKGSKNIVDHADDGKYYFYNETANPPTKSELKMRDILIGILLDYIKTDKPSLEGIDWKPVKPDCLSFLNIFGIRTGDTKIETSANVWNVNFWRLLVSYINCGFRSSFLNFNLIMIITTLSFYSYF